ncbi:putative transcription regulator IWS1 family [Helianthus annuus]|uniref:Putative transcription factor IIS n=1 Tax=Helianthus annuus TaxID=4232 RepID=A0A251TKW3_HELAN|nr:probable mediator of RNA polymerase II transcription subunit 26b isoform X1 [Helianthus annuus]KAF5786039.1 putative transcription regulator IWS1 family [Helianthus annuus]KAJ0513504.1 putative transcription regulator IWS1 family [Helianthus annuus]KAJ0521369.1 putative transcription regulator IWS1 family [Helianthus annuus]KAJ0529613.1 putative transcription regulator IWS1 family [Helianthus annuus]KAJ0696499.1 putative transcription regulator IWS1 family [Helianthus annuus]
MGSKSAARMGYWREYFKTSNGDIFETIEKAIMIAACDYPKEFGVRRDGIAQTLFNCKLIKCYGCDKVELGVPDEEQDDRDDGDNRKEIRAVDRQVSSYSYGVAEALTDEIEEESQVFGEVMRIREIVDNHQDESESVLYNSLRKLQLMDLSVETLKATEIGKSVNVLRKHVSKDVSSIAKTLIEAWKILVDEWVMATEKTVVSEATPDSLNPSVLDEEEGLPSPPLDDLTFLYPHGSLELSEFFDGMDEYGNPGNSGGFNKNHNSPKPKQQKPSNVPNTVRKNEPGFDSMKRKQPTVVKPIKPAVPESEPRQRVKPNVERKLQNVLKRPPQQIKQRASGEATAQEKFEAAKRKLQERYQEAKDAKKQRTIQVMELHDLPKPKGVPVRNQQNVRPGSNHNRHR